MSPLRHDGEMITYRPSGPSWIDEVIAEARSRGEFDDLSGIGQPLNIKENPLAGDWELAFHILENAGMAPPWMELSREIREGLQELVALREDTARRLAEQRELARTTPMQRAAEGDDQRRFRWWPFCRTRTTPTVTRQALDSATLEAERQAARRWYLQKAAEVEELIATYNAWLTDDLRQLRKPRLSPATAAQRFDAACPPILVDNCRDLH
jgi:hypothetical protein